MSVRQPSPHATQVPSIEGDAVDGAWLQTDGGSWEPATSRCTEQWQRCDEDGEDCADIPEATDTDYYPWSEDVGHTLRVVATGVNADGLATSTSEPSSVVSAQPPFYWWQPSISGLARQDGTLTADLGGWGGTPDLTYAYAWQRCDEEGESCAPIAGADEQTYTLTGDDLGARLMVEVTASNAAGDASATSGPTDVVDAPAVPALADGGHVAIGGDTHDGQALTADPVRGSAPRR